MAIFIIFPCAPVVFLRFAFQASDFTGEDPFHINNIFIILAAIIGTLVFVIGALVGLWLIYRKATTAEENNFLKAQDRYAGEIFAWRKAIERWNRLYYCHRNGIVFDPETNETCEPANIKIFVYQQAQS